MQIIPAGENSLIIYAENQQFTDISEQVNAWIAAANNLIRQQFSHLIIDTVPSYASLLVIFDWQKTDFLHLKKIIKQQLKQLDLLTSPSGKHIELPVYYNAKQTPDLARIADASGLSIDEVIACHQQTLYQVYAVGFAPGFAFMGQVDSKIATPRLATPRAKVPKGAVAIADRQTAVYPNESPGGWNLIGLCPSTLFDSNSEHPMVLAIGDKVKFHAIDKATYHALSEH